ncbi:MAG: hypothetical protein IMF19_08870, partial [Proteobacteria bacterium]|nr:hypothetical protein [Pseudomonadota bacterium]
MLSGLDLLKKTDPSGPGQVAKTGLDLLQGIAPVEEEMQVKTGLSLLNQQVVTEAPTTEVPVITDVHPATAYLEKFTEPPTGELEAAKYQMAPLITAENTAPAMDTLGRLWNLAQHPYDVVKGAAVFASEIPGFVGGLASAVGQVPIEILKGGTVLDWYNASARNMQTISGLWHKGVSAPLGKLLETPEKMGEELARTMFGAEPEVHRDEAELVGEIFMVPYTASSVPLHELADSPTWDNHPNVRGLLKFGADALGLVTMGLVLKGGPVMAARKVDPIVKKAHEIDGREKAIDASGLDEILKDAQKKVLDAEKRQLELEIESLKKDLDHEKLAKEDLKEKGKKAKEIKEGVDVETEAIREERLKFAEEVAKEIPEEKVKTGIRLIKKEPKPPEPVTDLDLQTGTKEPPGLSTEKSPFRETPEHTQAMKDVYAERAEAVRSNPELMTNKLLNDVNRWLDGEELPVEKTKNDLSELAARADELRKLFRDPAAFDHWKSTTSSAAIWARNADRAKIERPLPSVDLNIMVPLDKVPGAVMDVIRGIKGLKIRDVYRNEEIFSGTGFWLGRDRKWRYEIDDSKIRFNEFKLGIVQAFNTETSAKYKLKDILDHPELYDTFPEIKDIDIEISGRGLDREVEATYFPDRNKIELNQPTKKALIHELQHLVNEKVGAFEGTSIKELRASEIVKRLEYLRDNTKNEEIRSQVIKALKDPNVGMDTEWYYKDVLPFIKEYETPKIYNEMNFPMGLRDSYFRDPGEIEARLTEYRSGLSTEQRKTIPPWESLDNMLRDEGRFPE